MDLTPQSANPKPPYPYFNPHHLYEYGVPPQGNSQERPIDTIHGLGLFMTGVMSGTTAGSLGAQDKLSTTNNSWHHRNAPQSSTSTPNILSTEYDPLAPFFALNPSSFTPEAYWARSAEVTAVPISPLQSDNTSQRSSVSSAHTSEIFVQAGSNHCYTPRIKMEEPADFCSGSDPLILSPTGVNQGFLSSSNPYPGSLEATYYHNPAPVGWSKVDYANSLELPSISSLTIPQYDRRSESQERVSVSSQDQRRSSSAIARTRQPRKLTTKEDANFQCHVKGCGKLFGRSYNYKAHLETHDSTREYHFPCTVDDCTKKFVRKTDLQRHHQSVHTKQRNYRCDYCSRHFARKDTLRRHMEDGCPKRFDIETLDFRPQFNLPNRDIKVASSLSADSQMTRHPSYSSSTHYSGPPDGPTLQVPSSLPMSSGPLLERHEFATAGWPN